MSYKMWLTTVLLAGMAFGCTTDRPAPSAPTTDPTDIFHSSIVQEERLQRLARTLALALHDSGFRHQVHARLEASRFREHKIDFQGLLAGANQSVLQDLSRLSGRTRSEIQEDAANAGALELYVPVPAHRARWKGEEDLMVATAQGDHDAPIGFDTRGRRFTLDAGSPPLETVLALVPSETDFSRPAGATCDINTCPPTGGGPGGGGSGGGPSGGPPAPGLYMTYAHVTQLFESWLKGDPEFEVHILGQSGQTDSLKSYQCAGEHAGGPYTYDQNTKDWTGSVLLFSQSQLDSYKLQHPGQSIRIFLVEDDDTACDIRSGTGTFEQILATVDTVYNSFTGGRDTTRSGIGHVLQKARSYQKLLQKLAQLIKTNDEMVGDAIEDSVVGQYVSGANWIVKGDHNVTNGWLKLVMK
ncbi:MAG: hypothetical protein ABI613_03445 [Gemmatimonadota bacterium]